MNNIKEEWRDVVGYEGYYQVSNMGRVRSIDRVVNGTGNKVMKLKGKLLRPANNGGGYLTVMFSKDGHVTPHTIHRLVATAFIANLHNYQDVNHKDECKTNNTYQNLEWCTPAYNNRYGTSSRRRAEKQRGKRMPTLEHPVIATPVQGGRALVFDSVTQGAKFLNRDVSGIAKGVNHYRGQRTAGGYYWRRVDNWTTELFLCRAHNEGMAQ